MGECECECVCGEGATPSRACGEAGSFWASAILPRSRRKRTAGTRRSPVLVFPRKRSRRTAERRVSTWGWRHWQRLRMGRAFSRRSAIAMPSGIWRGAGARLPARERQCATPPGNLLARQSASPRTAAANRLPPQDRARARQEVRHDLSRGLAGPQPGQVSPPRQEHRRCWVERVARHPELQSCRCCEVSTRGSSCIQQPVRLWLWRPGRQRLICVLACVPKMSNKPASRSQRGEEQPMARAAPSGTLEDTGEDEPRTHRAVAPAECQFQGSGILLWRVGALFPAIAREFCA